MTTCSMNNQINDKRKMSILREETLLESGKLFKKNCGKFPHSLIMHAHLINYAFYSLSLNKIDNSLGN